MSEWIDVNEKMPEEPFACLVVVDDCEPYTGREFLSILPYFVGWDGIRWNDGDGEQCPFEVKYWMPLPNIMYYMKFNAQGRKSKKATNEYIEKLRKYRKETVELRKYIEKNECGNYWRIGHSFFDTLGKIIHWTEEEIAKERICIRF